MASVYPDPLPPGTDVITFVPDSNLSWVAVYALSCEDPECTLGHKTMLMIPVVGWIRVELNNKLCMRPALMLGNGDVVDYLSMSNSFQFIAILRDGNDVGKVAREVYAKVYGDDEAAKIVTNHNATTPN